MKPIDIRPVGDTEVLILWEDSHRSLYTHTYLRSQCPCAQCIDEWSGKRTLDPATIKKDIQAKEFSPIGNYAVRFLWNDGHHTGIYDFKYLRSLCPCRECRPPSSL